MYHLSCQRTMDAHTALSIPQRGTSMFYQVPYMCLPQAGSHAGIISR